MATRYTTVEKKQAVTIIVGLLIDGMLVSKIRKKIAKDYDISERTFYTWRKKAEKVFEELSDYETKAELGKAISRLNNLYSRLVKKKNFRDALAVQRELNELLGLKTIHIKEDKTIEIITSIPTAKEE
jgi:transposase-like protein